jgi:chromosome segregation ATPase
MQIRRTLAVGALSAIAFAGLAGAPANADTASVDCTTVDAAIDTAKEEYAAAKDAWKDSLRPMGKLMKVEREDARAEARQSDREIKALIKEARKSDGAERRELVKELKAERKELKQANRLLDSRRALREEVKDDRRTAKSDWDAAKEELRELRNYRSTQCNDETEVEEPAEEDETEVDEPAEA